MRGLTDNTKRAIVGIALVVALGSAVYYLELHAFGHFDKQALGISFVVLFLVVRFARPTAQVRPARLTWTMFGVIATVILAISLWNVWNDYVRSGQLDLWKQAWLVIPVWLLLFMAYRWRLLRNARVDGTFSEERYRSEPGRYIFGPLLPLALWMALSLGILVVIALVHAIRGN
jgi:hypothetical protein